MAESSRDIDSKETAPSKTLTPTPLLFSSRLSLSIWGLIGFMNMYILRVNLSVALVAMVKSTEFSTNVSDTCPSYSNDTFEDNLEGEFDWDPTTRSTILAAFFYGYIFTQIPGGILAKRFGGKALLGYGGLCTAILTLFTPLVARSSWQLLVALRVMEGLGEGVTFPAMNTMFGRWAPPSERSILSTITFSGQQLGTILALPLTGLLCRHVSWDFTFYVTGIMAVIWFGFWMMFTADDPSQSSRITPDEREYIIASLKKEGGVGDRPVPWYHIWCSPCVWAIIIAHTCHNWTFYIFLTETPSFLHDILHFDIERNGFLSALPYILQWMTIVGVGWMADILRRHCCSTTIVRKTLSSIAFSLIVVCLVSLALVGCNKILAMLLLIGATGFSGFNYSAFNVNHLDIAPEYAGILFGMSNTFATIPGFAGPALVGVFTSPTPTVSGWASVFYISAAIGAFGGLAFLLLASGEVQPWARNPPDLSPVWCKFSTAVEEKRLLDGQPDEEDE